jgi:hypothetical protein
MTADALQCTNQFDVSSKGNNYGVRSEITVKLTFGQTLGTFEQVLEGQILRISVASCLAMSEPEKPPNHISHIVHLDPIQTNNQIGLRHH